MMQKCLYLLCPTDCLEPVINNVFKHENYFYFSLGNSFLLEENTIECLKQTIKKHHINEVSFVLSSSNYIVKDALETQDFIKMRGLSSLYNQIAKQKKYSELFWQTDYNQFSILSYYLNSKIKELQFKLGTMNHSSLKINGKIYDSLNETFKNIYSDLVCVEEYALN